MFADLWLAARSLGKARGFSLAVVLTLATAIALEAAMLAVVNAYFGRGLPYPSAERLYNIRFAQGGEEQFPPDLSDLDWASLGNALEHQIAWDLDMFYMIGGEHAEGVPGAWVTPGYMEGLGVRPAMGRAFSPQEFEPGSQQVALISHS